MDKPSAIADKPFSTMNVNTSKKINYYIQGQRKAAKRLFILWLLALCSPEGAFAEQNKLVINTDNTKERTPDEAEALVRFGNDCLDSADPRKAISFFECVDNSYHQGDSTELPPVIAKALVGLGYAWLALENPSRAISFFERVDNSYHQGDSTELPPVIAKALVGLGRAFLASGNNMRAISLFERVYNSDHQGDSTELPPVIAEALVGLGTAWQALPNARNSVNSFESALAIYKQVYQATADHPHIASTLNNLANAYRTLGDTAKANDYFEKAGGMFTRLGHACLASENASKSVSFFQKALAIYKQAYKAKADHPHIASTLNNLGTAWLASGDARKAVSFLERALAMKEQVYAATPDHPNIASTLNNLGNACLASGDARKAVSFLERALGIYKQFYPETPNHPDIASTLNNLGNACLTLWDWSEAESYFEQAASMFYKLAENYCTSGNTDEAIRLYQHALDNYKLAAQHHVSGDPNNLDNYKKVDKETYHPGMAEALVGLGDACFTLGKADEAKRCFELAASMFYKLAENYLTSGNADEANRCFELAAGMFYKSAVQYHASGNLHKAVSLYQHALENYKKVPNETPHLAKAKVLVDWGDAWDALGNAYQAVTVYQEALKNLGNGEQGCTELLVRVHTNLNKVRQALDQAKQDVISYEQALGNCETIPNATFYPDKAKALGEAYLISGETGKAEECFKVVAAMFRQWGDTCLTSGKANEALTWYRQALDNYEKVPNETPDPDKAKALVGLGNTCLTLGNAAEAIKCYTSALEIYQRIHFKREASGNQNSNPDWCHLDIASTLKNFWKAYQALGQVEEACTYYYEACMMLYPGILTAMMWSPEAPLVNASRNCQSNYGS